MNQNKKGNNDWDRIKKELNVGDILEGKVVKHAPFGVFLDLNGINFLGLIQVTDFGETPMTSDRYPPLNSSIKGKVLGFKETGQQIWMEFLTDKV